MINCVLREIMQQYKLIVINFIIWIYSYNATICSFVEAFLTTYRSIVAVFCNYEIDSIAVNN